MPLLGVKQPPRGWIARQLLTHIGHLRRDFAVMHKGSRQW